MQRVSALGGFLYWFVIVFGLFAVWWPSYQGPYSRVFRETANGLFQTLGAGANVRFLEKTDGDVNADTWIELVNHRTGIGARAPISSWGMGFKPTAFVLALTLATPVPWRRMVRAAVLGLVAVQGYIALRLICYAINSLSNDNVVATFTLHSFWKYLLWLANWLLNVGFGGWLMLPMPLMIWALVTFRRSDWYGLFGVPSPTPKTARLPSPCSSTSSRSSLARRRSRSRNFNKTYLSRTGI